MMRLMSLVRRRISKSSIIAKGCQVMNPITVYTKPGCAQCVAVFRFLDKMAIDYRRADISIEPQARDHLRALGYLQVPVIYAGPGNHFSGFRPDRLTELAAPGVA